MPTPNQLVSSISTSEAQRPTRHIACPEETSVTNPNSGQRQSRRMSGRRASIIPISSAFVPPEHLGLDIYASLSNGDEKQPDAPGTGGSRDAPMALVAGGAARDVRPTSDESSIGKDTIAPRFRAKGSGYSPTLPLPLPHHLDTSTKRVLPSYTSSFLRPGSKFVGQQRSDRNTYEVQVDVKHVDMAESFMCGYLRIKGLTEDHPTLTTYFEGEMIGDKHSFQTRRPEWDSTEKNDFAHWTKFPAFRPIAEKVRRSDFVYTSNFSEKEHIFMRWKEYFLVPDHRVRQILGASFEGFYYICFSQVTGKVSGIYFHSKSEKFQRLELNRVPERTFSQLEFR